VFTSRNLIVSAGVLLALSAVFGVLNLEKTRRLRSEIMRTENVRQTAEQLRISREKELQDREAAVAAARAAFSNSENKVPDTDAALLKAQAEKSDLEAKVRQNEIEIAELRKRLEQSTPSEIAPLPPTSTRELQTQLEETQRQLHDAEKERLLLADKLKKSQERAPQVETPGKARTSAAGKPGVRGSVLAVNQAYNFVVLSLGARQGVEANSEMLVLRSGSFIGKIRISSVEPATAIGDIITSTLARGVQVQTGDIVIYAGNNF
jgi:hypothetical protein